MKDVISADEALTMIEAIVEQHDTKSAAAKYLGISPSYLQDILNGTRAISNSVAKKLGYSRVIVYEKQDWQVND